jgi:hypothetical protein
MGNKTQNYIISLLVEKGFVGFFLIWRRNRTKLTMIIRTGDEQTSGELRIFFRFVCLFVLSRTSNFKAIWQL